MKSLFFLSIGKSTIILPTSPGVAGKINPATKAINPETMLLLEEITSLPDLLSPESFGDGSPTPATAPTTRDVGGTYQY